MMNLLVHPLLGRLQHCENTRLSTPDQHAAKAVTELTCSCTNVVSETATKKCDLCHGAVLLITQSVS